MILKEIESRGLDMVLKATVSTRTESGNTSLKHNDRTVENVNELENKNSHIDVNRTQLNEVLVNEDMHKMFNDLFQPAVDEYNDKQKRKSRKINDFEEHVKESGNLELYHEEIVQFGNKDFWDKNYPNGKWATEKHDEVVNAFTEYLDWYQDKYPFMHVHNAAIHMDEGSPHMQIVAIPVATDYKKGVKSQPGFNRALKQNGLDFNQYRQSEYDELGDLMERHLGIEHRIGNGSHDKLPLGEYKSVKRLQKELTNSQEELNDILEQSRILQKHMEDAKKQNEEEIKAKQEASDKKIADREAEAEKALEAKKMASEARIRENEYKSTVKITNNETASANRIKDKETQADKRIKQREDESNAMIKEREASAKERAKETIDIANAQASGIIENAKQHVQKYYQHWKTEAYNRVGNLFKPYLQKVIDGVVAPREARETITDMKNSKTTSELEHKIDLVNGVRKLSKEKDDGPEL